MRAPRAQGANSVAIGGHRWLFEVIRGHPRGHQGSSGVIRATHLAQPIHELGLGEIIRRGNQGAIKRQLTTLTWRSQSMSSASARSSEEAIKGQSRGN